MYSNTAGLNIWFWCKAIIIWILMVGSGIVGYAQTANEYDEISISFNIQRVGTTEMTALIHNETAYLPIIDLFDFLKINLTSRDFNLVSGTFLEPQSDFLFDLNNNNVVYKGRKIDLKPNSLIKTTTNVYLRSDYFGEIFGLNCIFNFRSLSVIVNTDLELPILRELRQEQMRNNLSKLQGSFKSDTIVGRTNPLFYFGTADYAFVTSGGNEGTPRDTRASLGLGGIIAGGETNIVLNYRNQTGFDNRQQYYLWRYVDNDLSFAKQFSVGKIRRQSISSIFAPVVGAQVTNSPTTYRRSYGTYTLSNYTEPNWTVELYVNGVLINYVKADAAGFYTFNVPLVYGNTTITLRFYGPFGEQRSTDQNINIPFNFLPENEFEYTVSAGMVEDGHQTRFARFSSNYGISRNITVGAGFEYLSSIESGTKIPFVNTSFRLFPNLLISAEYDYDVRSKTTLNYNLPGGIQFELYNNWYTKGQTAINTNFIQDHKAIVSFPLRSRVFSAFTRLSFQEIKLLNTRYNVGEWMLSTVIGSINASATTYALLLPDREDYIYSNFSLGIRPFRNVLVTQQLQYEYGNGKVISARTELEKRIFVNGYLNLSFERNFISDIDNIEFGVRYDFSFAQTRASVRKTNDMYRVLQGVTGSLIHDGNSGITDFNNYTSMGKGSVLLIPYLDINGNKKRDKNEPNVEGLKAIVNGGRIERKAKNSSILITDIEAYTNYNIELDPSGFEQVAWKLLKKNYTVVIEPNLVKNIEIPVSVFGEVSGQILQLENQEEIGVGGIIVAVYNDKSKKVAEVKSEQDGYFSYLGLLPGKYTAKIDSKQLEKLGLSVDVTSFDFTILPNIEGTFIDDIKFMLKPMK